MGPFLLAAALDTVVAPTYDEAFLHEWGVVVYAESTVSVVSSPGSFQPAPPPDEPIMVEAPVIYLYGGSYAFDLTVRIPSGTVTSAFPAPDGAATINMPLVDQRLSSITWRGMRTSCPYTTELLPGNGSSEERSCPGSWLESCAGIWREVESLNLLRDSDGFADRFMYYECSLSPGALPLPLARPGLDPDGRYSGPVLVFSRLANGPGAGIYMTHAEDAWAIPPAVSRITTLTADEAFGLFSDWADGDTTGFSGLKPLEIQTMWRTWAPYFLEGDWPGTNLVVFPIPRSMIDDISTIELRTDPEYPVVMNRFFLGMVSI